MDRAPVFGTVGEGSTPSRGSKIWYNKTMKLLPAYLLLLLAPILASAQTSENYGGLLEGVPKDPGKTSLCHIFLVMKNVINFLFFTILLPTAILLAIYIGVMYYFGGDDPGKILKAQKTFKAMLIGLFIMFSAWLFVNLFMQLIGVADPGLKDGWFIMKCVD